MSVNKRGNRGREDALRYGSVAFQILPLNCMRRMFYPALTVCAVRLSPHRMCLWMFLSTCRSVSDQDQREQKKIISMNVLSAECVSRSYRTHCVYTHTWMLPWCVVFFDILWFCRATYTRVCWMCVLYVFFSFFFFWRVVQFNKVLNVTVKVRSKLWPGWRDFSSLGGVFTTTICHLPNTRLHRPPLCVSKLKVFLNMSVLINAWSH